MRLHSRKYWRRAACALGMILTALAPVVAYAQATKGAPSSPPPAGSALPGSAAVTADPMAVPGFWDPRRRPERPDLSRMICEELKVACTVQMRRFDTLISALNSNNGDAVIASIAATPEMRARVDFSDPYYRTPARFVSRRDSTIEDIRPEALEGKKIAVVAGTAHEAFLKALFTEAELRPFPDADAARFALKRGEVDLLFGDGVSLAFWLNGTDSANCCVFRGGPYLESRFFGEGVGIAVRRGNDLLRQAFNWALFRLWEKGRFTDLWLRYFPVSPF